MKLFRLITPVVACLALTSGCSASSEVSGDKKTAPTQAPSSATVTASPEDAALRMGVSYVVDDPANKR